MAVVSQLDLLYACLAHPRSVVGGRYCCAKFGWNHHPCSFEDMRVSILCQFHTPFAKAFGSVFGVKWGNGIFFAVLSLYKCNNLGLTSYESNNVEIASAV